MKEPTIASVKMKIDEYRKTRKSRRQPIPSDIIEDLRLLSKSNKKSTLKRELKITDSAFNRVIKKSKSTSVIRVAPVLLSEAVSMSLEVTFGNGQAMRLSGLPSVTAAAEIMHQLMGDR